MITKKSLQNLNGLLMLSAIAKYQSKRKVAEVTNSSIDTVNKYISNLEQVLGVQLVVNNAKGTYLTSRAELIVEQVENLLVALEMYRVEEEKAINHLADILTAYGIDVSAEEIRTTETETLKTTVREKVDVR